MRILEKPLIYRKCVERGLAGEFKRGVELLTREKGGARGFRRSARVPFPAKSLSQSWPRIIVGQVIPKLDDWPVASSKTKGQNLPYANVLAVRRRVPPFRDIAWFIAQSPRGRSGRSTSFLIVTRISREVQKILSRFYSLWKQHI